MSEFWKLEETVIFALRKLYQQYGYAQFKMSKFEPYDLYMQNKEFLVSDGIITFTDTDGTLMALKPDVTLSIVKNYRSMQNPIQKVCYSENVYRIAGASRNYREIMQTGLECLGDVGLYEIGEVLLLAVKSLEKISESYVLDLSHMTIVREALDLADLTESEANAALEYLGEKNEDALQRLLPAEKASPLLALMKLSGPIQQAVNQLPEWVGGRAKEELQLLTKLLARAGMAERVQLDFSIISNQNYYNGIVFRGYVQGIPEGILSGGQYDRLMEKMSKNAKGVGFAVYLDQLELLDSRAKAYDIDTVLLYDDSESLIDVSHAAAQMAEVGVLVLKQLPECLHYRRLLQMKDGRLEELENNG